jgi:hypothetical protein
MPYLFLRPPSSLPSSIFSFSFLSYFQWFLYTNISETSLRNPLRIKPHVHPQSLQIISTVYTRRLSGRFQWVSTPPVILYKTSYRLLGNHKFTKQRTLPSENYITYPPYLIYPTKAIAICNPPLSRLPGQQRLRPRSPLTSSAVRLLSHRLVHIL